MSAQVNFTELRLFIAIELPAEVRETLWMAQDKLAQRRLAVRWVDPQGTHLTLKFLGATPPARVAAITEALRQAARNQRPFSLQTAGLGVFPRPQAPRVVWLGVDGALDELRALQAAVERHVALIGYPSETRPFSPHLTLGRTMKDARGAELAAIGAAIAVTGAPASMPWKVDRISLMRSELGSSGARYTRMAEIALGTRDSAREADAPTESS